MKRSRQAVLAASGSPARLRRRCRRRVRAGRHRPRRLEAEM